jgi:hypothetical protein
MIGTSLSHYRITEKLGEGGMGIHRSFDTRLNRTVALKVLLLLEWVSNSEPKRRFFKEYSPAARDYFARIRSNTQGS